MPFHPARNAWTYEQLLTTSPQIGAFFPIKFYYICLLNAWWELGSALTFFQMLFITLHTSPSFLTFQKSSWLPRLKPRQVPIIQWTLQVFLVTAGSLLLNWAHAYKVPLTVLIVFRSAGLYIPSWKVLPSFLLRSGHFYALRLPVLEEALCLRPNCESPQC